jgi:hypothetical protein
LVESSEFGSHHGILEASVAFADVACGTSDILAELMVQDDRWVWVRSPTEQVWIEEGGLVARDGRPSRFFLSFFLFSLSLFSFFLSQGLAMLPRPACAQGILSPLPPE